ncbi:hypothetical protein JCM11251_006929 [Rhodosporidiobolus azoricus]
MQPWRGAPSRPSFPAHSYSTNNPSTSSAFGSSTLASDSGFGSSERGRGRGRGRGSTRGGGTRGGAVGAPGVQRHSNLSWRKTLEEAVQQADEGTEDSGTGAGGDLASAAAQSAFAAFGDPSSFGTGGGGGGAFGAFGSAGGGGANTFGGGGGSAFGNGGAFASSAGKSAFGAGGASAFPSTPASTSAFASSSTPLFRPTSTDDEEPGGANGDYGEEDEEDDEEDELQGEQEEAPFEEPAQARRAPGQISTLEVLGEDSDARRKRFEATLPNNRYLELKPLREAERLAAIKSGLIPDPSKPMRLDEATDFEGTCEEMCPEWEREEREYQNNVDPLERYPGTNRIDPTRAVKAFHRPAAGNDQPLPGDVRPPHVLHSTLNYLFHNLLPTLPLATTHPFLRDRTRSIRQDFTVQNVRGASAIECNERIARYHILALGTLREQSGFSESQELEQLRKVLKSLNEFYDDARLNSPNSPPSPNEAEFRAYNLLTHLRDPDIVWSIELLPGSIFSHPLLQTALALHRLAQKSNIPRGERASLNAASRFFKLVAHPSTPYLFGCILSTHFNDVRKNALEGLRNAYMKQHSAFPLAELAKILGCDGEEDARSVCEQMGAVVRADEGGRMVAELSKGAVLKNATLKPRVSKRLVEAKRGSTPYPDVIDGRMTGSASVVQSIPQTSSRISSATATHSASFSFGNSSSSNPASTSTFLAPVASTSRSTLASPIPTPVPTPPPGLNAFAPAFVPSFNGFARTSPPADAAVPASVAPTIPAASSAPTAFPSTSASALPPPAFSFAPAPAPAAAPPPSAVPNFFAQPAPPAQLAATDPAIRPTKRLPPSSLRTAVTASPFVPSLQPLASSSQPALPSPLPLISPRISPRVSPSVATGVTNRRVSVPLTSPHPNHPTAASHAAHLTSALAVRRKALVDSLAQTLTQEILLAAVAGPARRSAVEALKAQWAALTQAEEEAKRIMAEELAREAVAKAEKLLYREVVFQVAKEEREMGWWIKEWARRTERQVKRREEEEVRVGKWREVVRGLEGARRKTKDEQDEEESDEELLEVEDDEDHGIAGAGEDDLDFGGLSLGGMGGNQEKEVGLDAKERDWDMAERLREERHSFLFPRTYCVLIPFRVQAAETRSRIWQRGTFLNILAARLSSTLSPLYLSFRPTYTTLLQTSPSLPSSSSPSPFASWLACKFDLDIEDGDRGQAEMDTPYADVEVRMSQETRLADAERTGLIVFDCTKRDDWSAMRSQLSALAKDAASQSLFAPILLVVLCPERALSQPEEAELRAQVANNLNLSALSALGLAASSVYIAHLDNAESEFATEVENLLSSFSIRDARVPTSLRDFAKPLIDTWKASLASAYVQLDESSASPFLFLYIKVLRSVVQEIESVAHPALLAQLTLPPFSSDSSAHLHFALQSYISSSSFRPAGHFPDVATALAQRPPMAEVPLARLFLDHLASFVLTTFTSPSPSSLRGSRRPTTLRGCLSTPLSSALNSLRADLQQAEEKLRPAPSPAKNERNGWLSAADTPRSLLSGRKRRASRTPLMEEEVSSPTKKPSLVVDVYGGRSETPSPEAEEEAEEPPRMDRLAALQGVLRETKMLLMR